MKELDEVTRQLLIQYALGELAASERSVLEARIEAEPELTDALVEISGVLDRLIDTLEPIPNPPESRRRLRETVQHPVRRYDAFRPRMMKLFELSESAARAILVWIEEDYGWQPTAVPGVGARHFEAGPSLSGADTGLVRFQPGAHYPLHRHEGRELTLVLRGALHFSTGELLGPGDEMAVEAGAEHALWSDSRQVTVYATLHFGMSLVED